MRRFPVFVLLASTTFGLTAVLLAEDRIPRKVALLIGVEKYKHAFDDVLYAERDVEALKKELDKELEVALLTGPEATKDNIDTKLKELIEGKGKGGRLQKGDVLLIALNGHGLQMKVKADDMKEDAFFCPVGAVQNDPDTMVSLSALVDDKLEPLGCTSLVLVDACHVAPDPDRGIRGLEGRAMKLPANTAILFSCGRGEKSHGNSAAGGGHGLFTYAVLQGLRRGGVDGKLSWTELVARVQDSFDEDEEIQRLLHGDKQQPVHTTGATRRTLLLSKADGRTGPDAGDASREPKVGEEREYEIARGVKMKFCWIPPGKVQLGSPKSERDAVLKQLGKTEEPDWLQSEAEESRGEYTSKGFWLGKFAVTQEEWVTVMGGKNPSWFCMDGGGKEKVAGKDTSRFPVEQVTWEDCQKFLDKLNEGAAGGNLVKVFGKRGRFVLPHEDEWEYASRGGKGNRRAYYFGNELNGTQANCKGEAPFGTATKGKFLERTTKLGSYESDYLHPWGLCDMHGNVYQWCGNNSKNGPGGPRAVRGGSWGTDARGCRSADRDGYEPGFRHAVLGCRACFRPD